MMWLLSDFCIYGLGLSMVICVTLVVFMKEREHVIKFQMCSYLRLTLVNVIESIEFSVWAGFYVFSANHGCYGLVLTK